MRRFLYRADELAADARLPVAEFASRHGRAFLVHLGVLGDDKFSLSTDETVVPEWSRDGSHPETSLQSYYIVPLRGRDDSVRSIAVGRSEENDVVIDDMSLSKQHAVFDLGQPMRLVDGNSKNGTFLADEPVGQGMNLESGQAVRLGSAEFTFLAAADLQAFMQRLKR